MDPHSFSVGLNPDSKQEKKTHGQLRVKDLITSHHMNNNKLGRDKNELQTIYCHVKISCSGGTFPRRMFIFCINITL